MKLLYFSFLICCLYGVNTYAQITITGQITNPSDVEGIHILNTSSRYNTVTNKTGFFSIVATLNDTLLISSIKYQPELVVISETVIKNPHIDILLKELVNELDEILLGPNLTGNIEIDLKKIKTEKPLNFDDVGIPGFKGIPEEKIPTFVGQTIGPTHVNIEALYKHLSGYYKKLRLQRKWEGQNQAVSRIINFYTTSFLVEAYAIPENRLYDFMLFCIETSNLQNAFKKENFVAVLDIFEQKSKEYNSRLTALAKKKE